MTRRAGNKPWKHIYGVDRKYTARVDRARDDGRWTPPRGETLEAVIRDAADQVVRHYEPALRRLAES